MNKNNYDTNSFFSPHRPTVACDFDGTLTTGQTWKGMRDYLVTHGQARIARLFMLRQGLGIIRFKLGFVADERKFKERWILDLLRLFEGFSEEEFGEMAAWAVEHELWPQRRQEVVHELEQHKGAGHQIIITSGAFEPIIKAFVRLLPGYQAIGTAVAFQNNRCTGRIVDELNVGERKAARLEAFTHNGKLEAAYGDTKRDIPMLEMSQHAVAVCPDNVLRQTALKRSWRIIAG